MDFCASEVLNPEGDPRLLLLCDHASNAIPSGYGDLGLSREDLDRHIGYDVGAAAVTRSMSRMLDCPAVLSCFSRLFIDPNRGEDDPTLVMKISDGAIIPGNRRADDAEIEHRLDLCYRPYNRAVSAAIEHARALADPMTIISIHSFTRQLRGRPERPWHVTILWDWDVVTAHGLMDRLRADPALVVGDNVPYRGRLEGDCMWRHATQNRLPHALIEIRNDLIETEAGQLEWAARLSQVIRDMLDMKKAAPEGAA